MPYCEDDLLAFSALQHLLFCPRQCALIHRRQEVVFTGELRRQTEDTAVQLHEFIGAGRTPAPVYTKRCESCSFYEVCLPQTLEKRRKIDRYLDQACEEL